MLFVFLLKEQQQRYLLFTAIRKQTVTATARTILVDILLTLSLLCQHIAIRFVHEMAADVLGR